MSSKVLNMIVESFEVEGIINDYMKMGWSLVCADIKDAPKNHEGTKVRLVAFFERKV